MKSFKQSDVRLMELLNIHKPFHVGPKIWSRVLQYVGNKIQTLELQMTPEQKISGIPPHTLTDWFRQYCDTRGGTSTVAYSRRQRQNILLAFEEIRKLWTPIIVESLSSVKNYARSPRRGFVDLRGMRDFQKSDLDRMRSVFAKSIAQHGIFSQPPGAPDIKPSLPDGLRAIKFYNVVFGLIANTGVTFPGCFSSFCRLQGKHFSFRSEGELVIPRNPSGYLWLSVTPDEISRISLIGLLCHASRKPRSLGIRRRQLRSLEPEEYLLGQKPSAKTIRQLRNGFNQWLRYLCRQAGVPAGITLETLIQITQARLPEIYSAEVIASLTCKINYHPIPPDQVREINDLRYALCEDVEIPRWEICESSTIETKRGILSNKNEQDASETIAIENSGEFANPYKFDENLLNSFFEICQPFLQGTATSNQTVQKLEEWGKERLGNNDANQALSELIKIHHQKIFQSNLTMEFPLWNTVNIPLIQRWNMACIAGWLAWRLRSSEQRNKRIRNIHTFLGYRRDALSLVRSNPQSALSEIGDDEMEEYFSGTDAGYYEWDSSTLPGSFPARTSVVSCWRSIRHYLSCQAGIQLNHASLAVKSEEKSTHYTRLVAPEDLQKLLKIYIQRRTPEAYCAYLAVLLAYYSGLRAIEIVRLRLSQIVVRGIPMIFVQHGKRGKKRIILLDDAPESFLKIIKDARDLRWRQSKDLNAPLIAFPSSQPSDVPCTDFIQAKRLSRWVVDVMNRAGLRSKNLVGDLPDLHRLRHSYVNRSFLIRLTRRQEVIAERFENQGDVVEPKGIDYPNDLKQISLNAGHATYKVTLEHYVHCLNMLQKDQLSAYQAEHDATFQITEWFGRRSFEEILDLDHARAHQIMRNSGKCEWKRQGERKMLGIRREDALRSMYDEIRI